MALCLQTSPEKYLAQRTLAEHVTRLVHGGQCPLPALPTAVRMPYLLPTEEGLRHAQTATRALFGDPQSLRSLSGSLQPSSMTLLPPTSSPSLPLIPAGEELTQLFSHAPTANLTFDLLSEDTTIAEVALKAAVVPSQCEQPLHLHWHSLHCTEWHSLHCTEWHSLPYTCTVLGGTACCVRCARMSHSDQPSLSLPVTVHLDRLLADGGLYLNGQRVGKGELFSTSAHVLPGNLSVFRVGKKTYQLLQWTQ